MLKIEAIERSYEEKMIPIQTMWQQNSAYGVYTGCLHDGNTVRLQEKRSLVTICTASGSRDQTFIVTETSYGKFYVAGMERCSELSELCNGVIIMHEPPNIDAGSPCFTERYRVDTSKTLYHIWSLEKLSPSTLQASFTGAQLQMDSFYNFHNDADHPGRSSHRTQHVRSGPHPLTDSGISSNRHDPPLMRMSSINNGQGATSRQGVEEPLVTDTPRGSSARSVDPQSREYPVVSSPIQGIRNGSQSKEGSLTELSLNSRQNTSSSYPSIRSGTASIDSSQSESEDDICTFLAAKCFGRELQGALQEASAGILQEGRTTEHFSKGVLRAINVQLILDDKGSHLVIKLDELMPLLQAALDAQSPNRSHAQAISAKMNAPLTTLNHLGYSKDQRKLEPFTFKDTATSSSHTGICLEECLNHFLHVPGSIDQLFRSIDSVHGRSILVESLKVIWDECGAVAFWDVFSKVGEPNLDGAGPQLNLDAEPEGMPTAGRAVKTVDWLESQKDGQESVASFCMDDLAQTAPIRQSRNSGISENPGTASFFGCAGLNTAEVRLSLQAGQNSSQSTLSASPRHKNSDGGPRQSSGSMKNLDNVITSLSGSGKDVAFTMDNLSSALGTGQLPLTVGDSSRQSGGLAALVKEISLPSTQKRVEFADPPTAPRSRNGVGSMSSADNGTPTSYARLLQSIEQRRSR